MAGMTGLRMLGDAVVVAESSLARNGPVPRRTAMRNVYHQKLQKVIVVHYMGATKGMGPPWLKSSVAQADC